LTAHTPHRHNHRPGYDACSSSEPDGTLARSPAFDLPPVSRPGEWSPQSAPPRLFLSAGPPPARWPPSREGAENPARPGTRSLAQPGMQEYARNGDAHPAAFSELNARAVEVEITRDEIGGPVSVERRPRAAAPVSPNEPRNRPYHLHGGAFVGGRRILCASVRVDNRSARDRRYPIVLWSTYRQGVGGHIPPARAWTSRRGLPGASLPTTRPRSVGIFGYSAGRGPQPNPNRSRGLKTGMRQIHLPAGVFLQELAARFFLKPKSVIRESKIPRTILTTLDLANQ